MDPVREHRLRPYKTPHRIHLETTQQCNLVCKHCYVSSTPHSQHHDRSALLRLLDKAKAERVGKVTLTGGEPFLHPHWKDVVHRSLDICDNLYILTNGLLLRPSIVSWLARTKVMRSAQRSLKAMRFRPVDIGVGISLDGLSAHGHVRTTPSGHPVDAARVLEVIHLCHEYGLHVTVNTTISNSTVALEVPQMYDLMSQYGVDRWQIDFPFNEGRMTQSTIDWEHDGLTEHIKNSLETVVGRYLKDHVIRRRSLWRLEIVQVFRYDILTSGFSIASLDDHPCDYQFGSLVVDGGEQIRFCPSLRVDPIAGYSTGPSAYEIFRNTTDPQVCRFLDMKISDLPCRSCRYAKIFQGGCRANSLSWLGNLWEYDPICCSLAPFVEDRIVPLLPKARQREFFTGLQNGHRGHFDRRQ